MKNKKEPFIPYRDYGFNHTLNLVLSFIEMYGNTYASNKHISERLKISISTISRTLKKLEDSNHIKIYNPNGRSRFIKLTNQPNQNEENLINVTNIPNQNEEVNLIKMTNNKKENNKLKKKAYNKPYKKAEEVLEDITDEIFMKPIKTNQIDEVEFQSRINEPNDFMDELLNKKLSSTFD